MTLIERKNQFPVIPVQNQSNVDSRWPCYNYKHKNPDLGGGGGEGDKGFNTYAYAHLSTWNLYSFGQVQLPITVTQLKQFFAYVKATLKFYFYLLFIYLFIYFTIAFIYYRTTEKADTPGEGSVNNGSLWPPSNAKCQRTPPSSPSTRGIRMPWRMEVYLGKQIPGVRAHH